MPSGSSRRRIEMSSGGSPTGHQGKKGAPVEAPVLSPEEQLAQLSEQVRVRFEKLGRIRERGENPYKNAYYPDSLAAELHLAFDEKPKEELESPAKKVSVAGRIVAIRDFGKASFVRLKDRSGLIQLY